MLPFKLVFFFCNIYKLFYIDHIQNSTTILNSRGDYFSFNFDEKLGKVYYNKTEIDKIDVNIERLEVISPSEYYYILDSVLYHRLTEQRHQNISLANHVQCMSFDHFHNNLWWISEKGEICSFSQGCTNFTAYSRGCIDLRVTNHIVTFLDKTGALYLDGHVYAFDQSYIPFLALRGGDEETTKKFLNFGQHQRVQDNEEEKTFKPRPVLPFLIFLIPVCCAASVWYAFVGKKSRIQQVSRTLGERISRSLQQSDLFSVRQASGPGSQ